MRPPRPSPRWPEPETTARTYASHRGERMSAQLQRQRPLAGTRMTGAEMIIQVLADEESGAFAREWIAENEAGRPNFSRMRAEEASQTIETVGKRLRDMMSFLPKPGHAAAPPVAEMARTGDNR
ncbi:MAG: hypothetical protein DMG07_03235 [Acidobacteria bacterium]|nr:MAG: hypothetical protein DMG07_03235 [Acidobacteriota bacterium]